MPRQSVRFASTSPPQAADCREERGEFPPLPVPQVPPVPPIPPVSLFRYSARHPPMNILRDAPVTTQCDAPVGRTDRPGTPGAAIPDRHCITAPADHSGRRPYRLRSGTSRIGAAPQRSAQACRLRRKHSTVFSIRQQMVIGPTPPGTGVITEARGATAA